MDLLLGGVAEGLLGDGERDVGVAGDVEVENLSLVGARGAEGANDDGGGEWLR